MNRRASPVGPAFNAFFGRGEHGGYIGLRPTVPATWLPPEEAIAGVIGSSEPYEWNVTGTDVAWICELGSERTHGSFEAFATALTAARIAGGVDRLSYDSPSLGRIETGWGRGLRVAGEEVAISGYPLIGDTHFRALFGQAFEGSF